MTVSRDVLRDGLTKTLNGTDFPSLGVKYEGKVRDNYSTPDGRRVLVVTDRISAFDLSRALRHADFIIDRALQSAPQ